MDTEVSLAIIALSIVVMTILGFIATIYIIIILNNLLKIVREAREVTNGISSIRKFISNSLYKFKK